EPLLQKNLPLFAEILLEEDYTVLIETGGHRDVSLLDQRAIKILDIKCPGSGESARNFWPNLESLEKKDQVKFVIKDRSDYSWAKDVIKKYDLENGPHLLISPVFGVMDYQELANWILQDGLKARMQLQLHKFIWHPDTKGV
ncbi:MAG: 7-carboxy-7-deazaguanine synthase, partial [bacterium]